jgi:hypothetical protein
MGGLEGGIKVGERKRKDPCGNPKPSDMPVAHRRFPSSFKALVLQNQREQGNSVYHDVRIVERPIPALKHGEILVKINAAGFNHREVGVITRKS